MIGLQGVFSNETSLHGTDYNAYEGFEQIGEQKYSEGNLVAKRANSSAKGQGQYVMAKPYALCYDGFKAKRRYGDEFKKGKVSLPGR